MATIASLTFNIFSRYDGSGTRAATRDIDDLTANLRTHNDKLGEATSRVFSLTTAFLTLAPAVIPIAAVAGAAAGGFAAVGVAAGGLAGIFGGALKGAIAAVEAQTKKASDNLATQQTVLAGLTPGTAAYEKQLKKVNAAQSALNTTLDGMAPAQQRFARAQIAMKDSWSSFITATQTQTLGPVSVVMEAVTANMYKLIPAVKAVAPLFMQAATAIAAWLNGPSFQKYIDLIIKYGVPALRSLMDAGRSVASVLGTGFQAFLPEGQKFFDLLAVGAAKLKDWASGGGFKDFLAYAKDNAPDVKKILTDLVIILDNVAGSMKDTSGPALTVVGILTDLAAKLPPSLITAWTYAWIAWTLALEAWALGATIAGVASTFLAVATVILETVMSPFFLLLAGAALTIVGVVVALVALGVGIYFLVKYWDTVWGAIKTAWFTTWDAIKASALAVWNFLTTGWGQFVPLLLGPIGILIFLAIHWKEIWDGIKVVALAVWDALQTGWSTFSGWITTAWNAVWDKLAAAWAGFIGPVMDTWHKVWPEAKLAAENIWNAMVVAWQAVWGFFTAAWNIFWGLFGGQFKAGWEVISAGAQVVWGLLRDAWNVLWTVITGIAQVAWAIISGAFQIFWSVLVGLAQVAWAILSGAWQVLWAVIQGIFSVFAAVFGAVFAGIWNVIVAIATGIWNILVAAWQALWAVITAIFLTLFAIFTGHWGLAWTAIKDAAAAIWNLITTAWAAVWNLITTIFGAFVAVFTVAWNALWAAVQLVASTFWAALQLAFQTFLTAVQTVWNTVWAAVSLVFSTIINAILAAFNAVAILFTNALNVFLAAIKLAWDTAWNAIKDAFNVVKDAVVTAAGALWNALQTAFNAGSSWLLNTFWNPVHDFFTQTIPNAFSAGVNALGRAWDALKALVRAPIQAVVDVVYNGGIVKLWNLVAGVFGAPKLGTFTLPAFAEGGPTGSGPAQGFPAVLHPNEHVWTAAEVAAAGGHSAVAALRSEVLGGRPVRTMGRPGGAFDDGGGIFGTGIGPNVGPDLIPNGIIGNALNSLKNLILGAVSGPFNAATNALLGAATGVIRSIVPGDNTAMEQLAVAIPTKMVKSAQDWVRGHDIAPTTGNASTATALAWARTQQGMPYQWGGDGNPSWDCSGYMSAIESVIRGEKPHRRWATGAFSGSVAPNGWMLNTKSPFMIGITNAGVGHTAGTLNGTNVECAGGVGVRVGGNARGYNDSMFTDRYGFTPAIAAAATSGSAQAIAQAMLSQFGWGTDQWPPLQALWQRESGWSVSANNPASGAFGIPQSLPASKMASAGADYLTNAATQIKWGLGYIKDRYGSPAAANAFQSANNWYGNGTANASPGWAVVGEHGPELMRMRGGEQILSNRDSASLVGGRGGDTITVTMPVTIQGNATPGVVDRLQRELPGQLTMAIKQGVGTR